MTFEVPSEQIISPGKVCHDISQVAEDQEILSASGKAKNFSRLALFRNLQKLWLSGVSIKNLDTLKRIISLSSLVIFNLRVESLSFLPDSPALENLAICQSPKLSSLSGIEHLSRLRSCIIFDCANIRVLDPLSSLTQLESLSIEGGMWKPLSLPTLKPLASLTNLKQLRLASIRVDDKSLQPLHPLIQLRDVFIAKTFPRNELAALAAALPRAQGDFLDLTRKEN